MCLFSSEDRSLAHPHVLVGSDVGLDRVAEARGLLDEVDRHHALVVDALDGEAVGVADAVGPAVARDVAPGCAAVPPAPVAADAPSGDVNGLPPSLPRCASP